MSMAMSEQEAGAASSSPPAIAQVLHWLTAALVLTLFGSGVMMKQIGEGPAADALYLCHKTTGALLLGLVLIRIAYRLFAQLTARWRKGWRAGRSTRCCISSSWSCRCWAGLAPPGSGHDSCCLAFRFQRYGRRRWAMPTSC